MLSQATLNGLAFPTAKVHYMNGTYRAVIRRDGQSFRGAAPYDHDDRNRSRFAALQAAYAKLLKEFPSIDVDPNLSDRVVIWGDADQDGYYAVILPTDVVEG